MAKILKAENIQTDLLGSNGNSAFSLQRNSSSLLTLHTNDCVGINTTSPSHKLEVRGSSDPKISITSDDQLINLGATFRIDLKNASSSLFEAGNISVRHTSSNQTSGSESAYMSFSTISAGSFAERMRILHTGNVGIGTTNPASKLHIAGGNIRMDNDTGLLWGGTANTLYGNSASNEIILSTNNAIRMVLNSAGNIGIGTTNPTVELSIENSTNPEIGLFTSGTERVKFSTGGSAQSVLAINIAGTERFRIDSSGRVGIGTTNPGIELTVDDATNPEIGLFTSGTERVKFSTGGSAQSVLAVSTGGTERFRIDSSGNVILGNGDTNATPANGVVRVTNASGTNVSGSSITISAGAGTGTGAGGDIILRTAPAGSSGSSLNSLVERLRIDSSGQVGIGTTSPSSPLHVSGSGATAVKITGGSSANQGSYAVFQKGSTDRLLVGVASAVLGSGSTSNDSIFWTESTNNTLFYNNGLERLRINSSGNVGIGTTNPSTMLHVAGVITHSAGTIGSNANGTRTVTTTTTTPTGGADGDIVLVI